MPCEISSPFSQWWVARSSLKTIRCNGQKDLYPNSWLTVKAHEQTFIAYSRAPLLILILLLAPFLFPGGWGFVFDLSTEVSQHQFHQFISSCWRERRNTFYFVSSVWPFGCCWHIS